LLFNTLTINEVINASICFSKENNNIKMSSIHMAIIRITIFIRKMYFYVLLIICKMLWCTINTTQMAFTIVMIIYTFIFLSIFWHYFATSSDKMCLWNFLYNHVHNQYHDHNHENINQMLLHSLLGIEYNQFGQVSWFSIKSSLLCSAIQWHEINS